MSQKKDLPVAFSILIFSKEDKLKTRMIKKCNNEGCNSKQKHDKAIRYTCISVITLHHQRITVTSNITDQSLSTKRLWKALGNSVGGDRAHSTCIEL